MNTDAEIIRNELAHLPTKKLREIAEKQGIELSVGMTRTEIARIMASRTADRRARARYARFVDEAESF